MIGNYLKPVSRPTNLISFKYTNLPIQNNKERPPARKPKILLLLITRATYRQINQALELLRNHGKKKQQTLNKIALLADRNITHTLFLALQNIKTTVARNQKVQRLLLNTANLLQRIEKYKLKQSFNKLVLNYSRSSSNQVKTYYLQRSAIFQRITQSLFKKHKKQVFHSIIGYARFVKSYGKVRVIAVIYHRLERQLKQLFLTKASRTVLSSQHKNSNTHPQTDDLKTKLQDMSVQIENKTSNINRLEEQLSQVRNSLPNTLTHQHSCAEPNRQQKLKKRTPSHNKFNPNNDSISVRSFNNNSNDNLNLQDMSFGSILGNLNKSRQSSKYDPATDCTCGYKPRCQKYKTVNDSLKTQLQIVKQQLEVAKDLNEHFTDQINNFLTNGSEEGDLEELKFQHRILMEERQQLKQKVYKYQKHITNLKTEFKIKMEELYRKVKKNI